MRGYFFEMGSGVSWWAWDQPWDGDDRPMRAFFAANWCSPGYNTISGHCGGTTMPELTLESLARRIEDVERRLNEKEASSAKIGVMAAGVFTGREFSRIVDEEGRKIREADREEARQEFGE